MDDGSSDASFAFLKTRGWTDSANGTRITHLRHETTQGISRSRRLGASRSCGDTLVFMDAHLSFPQPDLLNNVHRVLTSGDCDLLGIDCADSSSGISTAGFIYTSQHICHQAMAWLRAADGPLEGVSVPFVNGGFFAIRRACYDALQGFPDFIEGWGHEDRFLSTVAHYRGFRVRSYQQLQVWHPYKTTARGTAAQPAAAVNSAERMLMNSLRCGYILYDDTTFELVCEQLSADYGPAALNGGLSRLEHEKAALDEHLSAIGLTPCERNRQMALFFERYRPWLPMVDEALLQQARQLDPQAGLPLVQALPHVLPSLRPPESTDYSVARLFVEAHHLFHSGDLSAAMTALLEGLTHDPDHLPSCRLLTLTLRQLGRHASARMWLEHADRVIRKHHTQGTIRPLACSDQGFRNRHLRHYFWPGLECEVWTDLAMDAAAGSDCQQAMDWLARALTLHPNDATARAAMASLQMGVVPERWASGQGLSGSGAAGDASIGSRRAA
ncbi:glycosyltransferase [Synechococcus sp. RSCCF101]|uniref:glycosyltransferase n=1 Tax=Synechococcus sp. RSCCF101 TaxID=2511069 RepID=UPI00351A92E0